MDLQLRGKRALVSGSTAGIGLAIAKGLSAEGARVIVNGREQASVDRARAEIAEATTADVDGYAGDLAQASVAAALAKAFPDVDILINNLGIFDPKPFEEIPDSDWVRFFEVNVLSGVRLSRLYLPRMREKDWGRIIFISIEEVASLVTYLSSPLASATTGSALRVDGGVVRSAF